MTKILRGSDPLFVFFLFSRKFFRVSAVNLPFLFLSIVYRDKMEEVMVEKPNVVSFKKHFKFYCSYLKGDSESEISTTGSAIVSIHPG